MIYASWGVVWWWPSVRGVAAVERYYYYLGASIKRQFREPGVVDLCDVDAGCRLFVIMGRNVWSLLFLWSRIIRKDVMMI